MATIYEIAQLANVSPATVSRVLNHDTTLSISSDKRFKILEIAEDLNYKTPKIRKLEKSSLRENFGAARESIVCILLYSQEEEIDDPYYLAIHHALKIAAAKRAFRIDDIYYKKKNDLASLSLDRLGTIIIGSEGSCDISFLNFLKKEKNVICVDFDPDMKNIDVVCADFRKSIETIAKRFAELGILRIAYIGGKETSPFKGKEIIDPRSAEFIEEFGKLGIYREELFRANGSYTPDNAYQLTKQLLSSAAKPEAIFVASDNMALGVYKAICETGLSIPQDIKVVSCNDQPVSAYMTPPLSTIRIPRAVMASVALSLASSRAKDPRELGVKVMVPTDVVFRKSFI